MWSDGKKYPSDVEVKYSSRVRVDAACGNSKGALPVPDTCASVKGVLLLRRCTQYAVLARIDARNL